jgi:tripartite-type tricarboxylate transporter receptor subunit TctC
MAGPDTESRHTSRVGALLLAAAACIAAGTVSAQGRSGDFPTRPIRYIVPFVAGAGTDITARTVAQKLGERIGQQVVVDNRPGAAGNIGMELTAKAPADGYTMVLVSASHTVNRSLQKLNYDLLRDFAPLSQITAQPYCLTVHPSVPVHTVKELLALARARPNTLTYGSSGTGGLSHLAGAMLSSLGKIEWIHVPYKGGAAAINDMLGGQINSQFTTIIGTIQHVKAGRLRWLAISTAKRSTAVPDLPTVAEAGVPGFAVEGWYGILAPAATPKRVVELLGREIGASLRSPDVSERFSVDGSVPVGSTPEEFSEFIRKDLLVQANIVKLIGLEPE